MGNGNFSNKIMFGVSGMTLTLTKGFDNRSMVIAAELRCENSIIKFASIKKCIMLIQHVLHPFSIAFHEE